MLAVIFTSLHSTSKVLNSFGSSITSIKGINETIYVSHERQDIKGNTRYFLTSSTNQLEKEAIGAFVSVSPYLLIMDPRTKDKTIEEFLKKPSYPLRGQVVVLDSHSFVVSKYDYWKLGFHSADQRISDGASVIHYKDFICTPASQEVNPSAFYFSNYKTWEWRHVSSKKTKSFATYTAIFGYSHTRGRPLRFPTIPRRGKGDFYIFTDLEQAFIHPLRPFHGMIPVYLPQIFRGCRDQSQYLSRMPKLLPNLFLWSYSRSLYVDNNFVLHRTPEDVANILTGTRHWGVHVHPDRHCAYEEMIACVTFKKENPKILDLQRRAYKQAKFPRQFGLWENGLLARDHIDMTEILCHAWWAEQNRYSKRDQISFAFALWKKNMKHYIRGHSPNLIRSSKLYRQTFASLAKGKHAV